MERNIRGSINMIIEQMKNNKKKINHNIYEKKFTILMQYLL